MPVATVIQAYSSFLIIGALIGFMKKGAIQPLIVAVVIAIVGFYAAGIENKHPKRIWLIRSILYIFPIEYGKTFLLFIS